MDGFLKQLEQKHDQTLKARRRHELDASRREALVAACEAVARSGARSVVGLGGRVEEEDVPLQPAWTVLDIVMGEIDR